MNEPPAAVASERNMSRTGESPSRAAASDRSACVLHGTTVLNDAAELLKRDDVTEGMDRLVHGLADLRNRYSEGAWRGFAREEAARHPIMELLRHDPLTCRSLLKPRGYAGDAGLLDFLHYPDRLPPGTSELGRTIFAYTTDGPASRGVRERSATIARAIDGAAGRRPVRVLAVMGGHLWEAELSGAVGGGGVETFLAFDQDARNLATVEGRYGSRITTYQGTIRSLVRGKSVFRNYDLIYSGLCDNLHDGAAERFTGALFEALAPGGKLLLFNFGPELVNAGYMEACMGWYLVYRDEGKVMGMTKGLPEGEIEGRRVWRGGEGSMVGVEVVKEKR